MKKALVILAGFLGSGKTTLLCSLLRNIQGCTPAVLLNDFGKIPVDGAILKRFNQGEGVVVEIGGGSVFCSCLKGSFIKALQALAKTKADTVIVEASGMSDPSAIGRMLELAGLEENYEHALTICLFDPIKSLALANVLEVIPRQLAAADVVVMTKGDIVPPEQMQRAETWIRSVEPDVPVVTACHGSIDGGIDWSRLPKRLTRRFAAMGFNIPENRPDSFCLRSIPGNLQDFLNILEQDKRVLRVKGYLHTPEGIWFLSDTGTGFEQERVTEAPTPLTVICMQGTAEAVRCRLHEHF